MNRFLANYFLIKYICGTNSAFFKKSARMIAVARGAQNPIHWLCTLEVLFV